MKALEKEYKVLISQEEYYKFLSKYVWEAQYEQINFYYSDGTNNAIENDITIRTRLRSGKAKLQVKVPISSNGHIHIKQEYSYEIDNIPLKLSSKSVSCLCNVQATDFFMIGYLLTERKVKTINPYITLFLDKNIYLGQTDYELEIEYIQENELEKYLSGLDIKKCECTLGKKRRFFERLQTYELQCE